MALARESDAGRLGEAPFAPASRPRFRRAAPAALLVVLTIAVWSFGLPGPYQFDDAATPLNDPASHSLTTWARHLTVTLRPLTKLTYAVEGELGLVATPAPRRALSIGLQATAAVLLFALLSRLEPGIGSFSAALLAGLWAVHPVHAESVLAVSGRTAVLSALFLFAALLALEHGRTVVAALLFFLACLARETALAGALPLLVLTAARQSGVRRRVATAAVLAAAVAALAWCLTTPRYLRLADYSFLGRPWAKSSIQQIGAVPVGLELLASPAGLSVDYGVALPDKPSQPLFLLGLALYAGAGLGTALGYRRMPCAAVGLALWLAALLPTQSVIPKLDALANRPLSLALAGILVTAAPGFAAARRRLAPLPARLAAGTAVALLVSLSASTVGRAGLYRSELALWGDAAAKSRTNVRPHIRYAMLLKHEGRDLDAWRAISSAREIDPLGTGVAALWNTYRPLQEAP